MSVLNCISFSEAKININKKKKISKEESEILLGKIVFMTYFFPSGASDFII